MKALGTHEIARLCHITPPTAIRWIEQGVIPSFKTVGGHRRVWSRDLAAFLAERRMPVPAELGGGAKKTVLVVDDEPHIRNLAVRILRKKFPDMEVHEAADGFEAGQKTSLLVPDLIVLDIQLPGLDGLRICAILRADKKFDSSKILAISGRNVSENREGILQAGADAFLGKPFSIEEFSETVKRLLKSPDSSRADPAGGRP